MAKVRGVLRWLTGRGDEERRSARSLVHLRSRVLDTPLAIEPRKLEVILSVLSDRIGLEGLQLAPEAIDPRAAVARTGGALPVAGPSVAVIPVHGTLVQRSMGLELDAFSGLTAYTAIREALDAALADPSVAEIVLDIDSPGGEVAGLFDLTDAIFAARDVKPITAVVNEFATSAAYAIAASASHIVAPKTAIVGSIGVILTHVDQSQANANEGLVVTHITAGAHKADGTPHAPLADAAKATFQAQVDELYGVFVDAVARYRGMDPRAVRDTEAQTYLAPAALALGLIDEVAPASAALAAALDRIAGAQPAAEVPALPVAAVDPAGLEARIAEAVKAARAEAAEVVAICRTFPSGDPLKLASELLARGASLDEVRAAASNAAVAADVQTINALDPAPSGPDLTRLLVAAMRAHDEHRS